MKFQEQAQDGDSYETIFRVPPKVTTVRSHVPSFMRDLCIDFLLNGQSRAAIPLIEQLNGGIKT